MKKHLLYAIIIYIIFFFIILNKKKILFLNNSGHIKSWNYFCNNFNNWQCFDDFITMPFIIFFISILSYLIAQKIN